jgi:hypothetical protein
MLPAHRRFAGGFAALPVVDAVALIGAAPQRTAIGAAHNVLVNTGNPR